jgi:hypothetical protein
MVLLVLVQLAVGTPLFVVVAVGFAAAALNLRTRPQVAWLVAAGLSVVGVNFIAGVGGFAFQTMSWGPVSPALTVSALALSGIGQALGLGLLLAAMLTDRAESS